LKDKNISLATSTSIVCNKKEGASVIGTFGFVADDNAERLVDFSVISPTGVEILRSQLKAEFEARMADLAEKRTSAETALSDTIKKVGDDVDGLRDNINKELRKLVALEGFERKFEQIFRPGNPGAPGVVRRCPQGWVLTGIQTYYEDGFNKYIFFCSKIPTLAVK
jgi:hypothetical protein